MRRFVRHRCAKNALKMKHQVCFNDLNQRLAQKICEYLSTMIIFGM